MNRLTDRLAWSRAGRRLFLVGYLPAGYPGGLQFTASVRAAFDAGVDAMEIGLPNPPRPLDGPLIQEAARIGASHVDGAEHALRLAVAARQHEGQAIIALAYRQAVDELGVDELLAACVRTGSDAVLLPEHPLSDQIAVAHRARAAGLEQILFLSLEEDLPLLADSGLDDPVIYLQSADLQTGGAFDAAKAGERLDELRAALGGAGAYVLVGFGVRGPLEIASLASSSADGAIVGTAVVEAAQHGPAGVAALVESIQSALPKRSAEAVGHG